MDVTPSAQKRLKWIMEYYKLIGKNILLNQIYDTLVIPSLLINLVLHLIYIKVNFLYIKGDCFYEYDKNNGN